LLHGRKNGLLHDIAENLEWKVKEMHCDDEEVREAVEAKEKEL
jgi:hypothetical protein